MSDGPEFMEPGTPETVRPFVVSDSEFPIPDHTADAADDGPAEPTRVESGEGVTSLIERARRRGGARTPTAGTGEPTPPKAEKKAKAEKKPTPPIPRNGFAPGIEKAYMTMGTLILPFDMQIGMTVVNIAPEAAKALDQLARDNPAFRRFLVGMMQTTTVGFVIAAHAPLLMILFQRAMGEKMPFDITQMFPDEANGGQTP